MASYTGKWLLIAPMWSHIQNLKIQTRPEEWFVQPVLCIVVTGSCPDLPLKTLYRGDQCQILELSLVEPPDSFVSCWLQVIAGRPLQKKLQIFFWVTSKDTDLIFVTNITNIISGEKLSFKFQLSMYDNCEEIENFSTCEEISDVSTWQMWRNLKFCTFVMCVM